MYCGKCDKKTDDNVIKCGHCGRKTELEQYLTVDGKSGDEKNEESTKKEARKNGKKSGKKRGFAVVVIVILIVIALAAGAFFLLPVLNKNKTETVPEGQVTEKTSNPGKSKEETPSDLIITECSVTVGNVAEAEQLLVKLSSGMGVDEKNIKHIQTKGNNFPVYVFESGKDEEILVCTKQSDGTVIFIFRDFMESDAPSDDSGINERIDMISELPVFAQHKGDIRHLLMNVKTPGMTLSQLYTISAEVCGVFSEIPLSAEEVIKKCFEDTEPAPASEIVAGEGEGNYLIKEIGKEEPEEEPEEKPEDKTEEKSEEKSEDKPEESAPEGNVFEDIVNGAKDKEQTVNGGEEQ